MSDPTPAAAPDGQFVIVVTLDGAEHTCRPHRVTPNVCKEFREQAGWRVPELMRAVLEDGGALCGPEEIAGLVFLARRGAGEQVDFDEVARSVNGGSTVVVDFTVEGAPDIVEAVEDPQL